MVAWLLLVVVCALVVLLIVSNITDDVESGFVSGICVTMVGSLLVVIFASLPPPTTLPNKQCVEGWEFIKAPGGGYSQLINEYGQGVRCPIEQENPVDCGK